MADEYVGAFVNGLPSGDGVCNYASGARYEGQWERGLKHGYGELRDEWGSVYRGGFQDDECSGHQLLTRPLASPLDARSAAELGAPRRGSPRRPPRAHSMGNQSPHHPRGSPAHLVSFPSSAPPLPSHPLRMASRARS